MKFFIVFYTLFSVVIGVSSAQSQTRLPYDKAPYNDTVIQCGALFAILGDAYKEMGDAQKSETYKEKFGKLSKTSEDEFVSVGRTKQEAQEMYQERVNSLAAMAEKDTDIMVRLVRFCDQKYPA